MADETNQPDNFNFTDLTSILPNPTAAAVVVCIREPQPVHAGNRWKTLVRLLINCDQTRTENHSSISVIMRAQASYPLDPLSATKIYVAIGTFKAARATPEVDILLSQILFKSSLVPIIKGGPIIPSKLPPKRARLVFYNKKSNETNIWIVELTEAHAAIRGSHHKGGGHLSEAVPNVQPLMDSVEYAECETVVKDYPPFREAMKR